MAFKDILVGDVWFCSGQSNMVHQMKLHNVLYEAEIAKANYPEIRQFFVPNIPTCKIPRQMLEMVLGNGQTQVKLMTFQLLPIFLQKNFMTKYHVPIGLINASWGGVPIESFMSEDALAKFPNIASTVQKNKDTSYINRLNKPQVTATSPVASKTRD